uniref:Uncharacterized protein n=1 Tax=Arundo donax TaxID=35708 RepID=A0A0A8XYD1_ARUDO
MLHLHVLLILVVLICSVWTYFLPITG